jgi:hypothetical protein
MAVAPTPPLRLGAKEKRISFSIQSKAHAADRHSWFRAHTAWERRAAEQRKKYTISAERRTQLFCSALCVETPGHIPWGKLFIRERERREPAGSAASAAAQIREREGAPPRAALTHKDPLSLSAKLTPGSRFERLFSLCFWRERGAARKYTGEIKSGQKIWQTNRERDRICMLLLRNTRVTGRLILRAQVPTFSQAQSACFKLNTASKELFAFKLKQGVVFCMFVFACKF